MGASAVVTDVFEHFSKILAKHDVKPVGVLHVGGHHGEEHKAYVAAGFEKILWMEPIPGNFLFHRAKLLVIFAETDNSPA
jgi:hypothetical protein